MTLPAGVPRASDPLAVLSAIAARLAEGGDIVATVSGVLERLRASIEASEVGLWLPANGALVCSARAGTPALTAYQVIDAIGRPLAGGEIIAHGLVSRGERLGVLAIRGPAAGDREARDLSSIVANLLAPELAHAQDEHRMAGEVAQSSRQIEAERRVTARIIDSLPVGLYVVDREYRVQVWNRNRETGYQGVSRDLAIGKPIFEVLHRQPADRLRAELDEVFSTGRIAQFNIESEASGSLRTYRITKVPMRLDDGPVTHVITIGEDITDWALAQERWAQSEKLAAIGQLAAGVMHEINNPLATIAACAESLSLRLDDMRHDGCTVPAPADEFLRIIDQEVQRCKRIIDGLLAFSRPRSAEMAPTNVNAVIEQTIFLLKHHARFKHVRLQTLLDAEIEPVPANAEQLIQVFMALLINATDAMGETGSITIRTRRGISAAEAVVAEVIDAGSGIARTDLPRIFEPFYTTKPPGRGTGLGLSVCYSSIAGHGGRIEVDSAMGAGSTFRILLPGAPAGLDVAGDNGGTP